MPNWFDLTSKERYELYRKRQPGQKYEDVMNLYGSEENPVPLDEVEVIGRSPESYANSIDEWKASQQATADKNKSYWSVFGESNKNAAKKLIGGINDTFGTAAMSAALITRGAGFGLNSQRLFNLGNRIGLGTDVVDFSLDPSFENAVDIGLNFIPGVNKYNKKLNLSKSSSGMYKNVLNPKAMQKMVGTSAYDVYNEFNDKQKVPAYEDGGIGKKVKDTLKGWYYNLEKLTPEAMGAYMADKDESFSTAYKNARSRGSKNFYWGNDKYTTDYVGEHHKQYEADKKSGKVFSWEKANPGLVYPELVKAKQEELNTYGITNEQTQNKKLIAQRLHKNLGLFEYDDPISRVWNMVVLNKEDPEREEMNDLIDTPDVEYNLDMRKEMDAFSNLLGYPMKYNTLKISDYKPSKGATSDYYYAFAKNKQGDPFNTGMAGSLWRDLRSIEDHRNAIAFEKLKNNLFGIRSNEEASQGIEYFNTKIKTIERNFGAGILEEEDNEGNFKWPENDRAMGEYTGFLTSDYMAYYDKWDLNPFGTGNDISIYQLGKPFDIYDRKYIKDTQKPSHWEALLRKMSH